MRWWVSSHRSRRPWSFHSKVEHSKPERKKVGKMPARAAIPALRVSGPNGSVASARRLLRRRLRGEGIADLEESAAIGGGPEADQERHAPAAKGHCPALVTGTGRADAVIGIGRLPARRHHRRLDGGQLRTFEGRAAEPLHFLQRVAG